MRYLLILSLLSLISCSSDRKTTIPDKPGAGATATQAELEQSADDISNSSTPTSTQHPVGTPAVVPPDIAPAKPAKLQKRK